MRLKRKGRKIPRGVAGEIFKYLVFPAWNVKILSFDDHPGEKTKDQEFDWVTPSPCEYLTLVETAN